MNYTSETKRYNQLFWLMLLWSPLIKPLLQSEKMSLIPFSNTSIISFLLLGLPHLFFPDCVIQRALLYRSISGAAQNRTDTLCCLHGFLKKTPKPKPTKNRQHDLLTSSVQHLWILCATKQGRTSHGSYCTVLLVSTWLWRKLEGMSQFQVSLSAGFWSYAHTKCCGTYKMCRNSPCWVCLGSVSLNLTFHLT